MSIGFYVWCVIIIIAPLFVLDMQFDDKLDLLRAGDQNIIYAGIGVMGFWIIGLAIHNRRYR